ncbi:MAG: hypothetical protein ACRDOU_03330 [Streptosporangiaceae bacterium]
MGTVSPDVPAEAVLGELVLLLVLLLQAAATSEVAARAIVIFMGRVIRALVVIIALPPLN